jgi:hypothetical protein
MGKVEPPHFSALRAEYGSTNQVRTSLADALQSAAGEPRSLLDYLKRLGVVPATLEELLDGINHLPGEEELAAFRCQEGVAVSHASDGWWLLFVVDPGSTDLPSI